QAARPAVPLADAKVREFAERDQTFTPPGGRAWRWNGTPIARQPAIGKQHSGRPRKMLIRRGQALGYGLFGIPASEVDTGVSTGGTDGSHPDPFESPERHDEGRQSGARHERAPRALGRYRAH